MTPAGLWRIVFCETNSAVKSRPLYPFESLAQSAQSRTFSTREVPFPAFSTHLSDIRQNPTRDAQAVFHILIPFIVTCHATSILRRTRCFPQISMEKWHSFIFFARCRAEFAAAPKMRHCRTNVRDETLCGNRSRGEMLEIKAFFRTGYRFLAPSTLDCRNKTLENELFTPVNGFHFAPGSDILL